MSTYPEQTLAPTIDDELNASDSSEELSAKTQESTDNSDELFG